VLAGCGGGGDTAKTSAAKQPPAGPAPYLGVSPGLPLLADPALFEREMPVMAKAGVSSVRMSFYWNRLEPERGTMALDETDAIVAAAARNGLDVLPVVTGTPGWAKDNPYDSAAPPKDPRAYGAFLTALIKRYGPDGSLWSEQPNLPKRPIGAWQIWNEPSHDYYWSTQPWAPSYVKLLAVANKAIKQADPKALTVLAGFPDRSWDSLAEIEDAGARGNFDVAALHPYTAKVANVLKIVQLGRRELVKAGDGDKPLWLTEVAWSSGKGKVLARNAFGFETTEKGQADRLGEVLPLLDAQRAQLGIERIYVETWASAGKNPKSTWDWAGLREVRGTTVRAKPAFTTFERFARSVRDR
jgi:polysaccharide biosynthesis protein PslG